MILMTVVLFLRERAQGVVGAAGGQHFAHGHFARGHFATGHWGN